MEGKEILSVVDSVSSEKGARKKSFSTQSNWLLPQHPKGIFMGALH